MADPDSGYVIFRKRNLSRGRCRKDILRGRHTGNVSGRSYLDTVVSLVALPVLVIIFKHIFFRKTYKSADYEHVESACKKKETRIRY